MDAPRGCNFEWSKSDRERQISYDTGSFYVASKKTKSGTDELIYKSNGHRYRMLIFKNIIFQSCKLLFKLSVSSLYA